jgi:hypothetical protein
MIRTYKPDLAVLGMPYDEEYPCMYFWHSHTRHFAYGAVTEPVGLVPFSDVFTVFAVTGAIWQSNS